MRGLEIWKVAIAVALACAIVLSIRVRAPRRSVAPTDLRRLVLSALMLYAVGALAWLTHHRPLAAGVFAAGIVTAALAAWLSRGRDSDDPRGESDRSSDEPPFSPDEFGPDQFDWASFERDFRAYSEGRCEPAALD
jgi:hypothetical protein